jgi:hypothetical protein
VKEIAVRMWRHAGSGDEKKGHPLAVQWVKLPVEVGQHVLTQIKGMPDARIREVTNGLVELNAYIRNGGDPENYAKGMKPKRGRPAKLAPVPDAPVEQVIEASSPSAPTPSTVQSSDMTSITSE